MRTVGWALTVVAGLVELVLPFVDVCVGLHGVADIAFVVEVLDLHGLLVDRCLSREVRQLGNVHEDMVKAVVEAVARPGSHDRTCISHHRGAVSTATHFI